MTYNYHADRRGFLKTGGIAGAALAAGTSGAFAQVLGSSHPTKGDIAILRFLSAVEQIESDLWLQYAELGGVRPDTELPGPLPNKGNKPYTDALSNLDADMPQYIHDNTEDEFSHHDFLNAYLQFIGATKVDLSGFATLKGSTADGVNTNNIGKRLTELRELKVDTSWWTRYRSRDHNPDLVETPPFDFPQAVPDLFFQRAVSGNPQRQ